MINLPFDECFPKLRVELSSNDPPFIPPIVKCLLKKRRTLLQKDMVIEANSVQVKIDDLIRQNQI